MGIGMVLVIEPGKLGRVEAALKRQGEEFFLIGQVTAGRGGARVLIK
jgi:phosphoribosylaminoimidazole (AIR) synthetase